MSDRREKNIIKSACAGAGMFCLGVFSYRGAMSQNLRIRHSRFFEYQRSGRFQNVWLNHEYAGNKEVDYNHLKVVLIERSFWKKRRKWKICYPCWSRKRGSVERL